jgi:hypothetical protein
MWFISLLHTQVGNIPSFIFKLSHMLSSKQLEYIKEQIVSLPKKMQDFVLSDMDTMLDIVENNMDSYEIDTMV